MTVADDEHCVFCTRDYSLNIVATQTTSTTTISNLTSYLNYCDSKINSLRIFMLTYIKERALIRDILFLIFKNNMVVCVKFFYT